MLVGRDFPGHPEKSDPDHKPFGVEMLDAENNPVQNEACEHGRGDASDHLMPLRICHGTASHSPGLRTRPEPSLQYILSNGFILERLSDFYKPLRKIR